MNQTELEILKDARKLILKGWVKNISSTHKLSKRTGKYYVCYCLTGAIQKASPDRFYLYPIWNRLTRIINKNSGKYYNNIPVWNDETDRRKKDVIHVLDLAIAEMEAEQNG